MPLSLNVQQFVTAHLEEEGYSILHDIAAGKAKDEGIHAYLQGVITRAEESDNYVRAIAANMVLASYGEEMEAGGDYSPTSMSKRLEAKIHNLVEG